MGGTSCKQQGMGAAISCSLNRVKAHSVNQRLSAPSPRAPQLARRQRLEQ